MKCADIVIVHKFIRSFVEFRYLSALKMTFNELKRYFRFMGIFPSDSSQREMMLCIIKNWILFGMFVLNLLTMLLFFVFDAKTFRDYSKCFFYMCCNMLPISWYSVYLWQRTKYIALFNDLDAIIERSE